MEVGLGHLDEGDAEVSAAFRIAAPTVQLMQSTAAVSRVLDPLAWEYAVMGRARGRLLRCQTYTAG